MTEAEAKLKWCPMVKYELGGRAVNRDACYDNAGTHCIGSACMMWRETVSAGSTELQQISADTYNRVEIPAQGYCGLAGKP
jgi:hypothetical protein